MNLVKYSAVSTYKGESDSILGKTFVSFLILLLFIWVMLLLSEFRYIWNFFQVIWSIPSTDNVDPNIASAADDGKFTVTKLPLCHKVFALLAIGVPRLVIACVVLYVGANFLAITNTLQDLVLNCTALGFLLEVDQYIHTGLMGQSFEILVMHRFEPMEVPSPTRGVMQTYRSLMMCFLVTGAYVAYTYLQPKGLHDIGSGIECLCQLEGNCYVQRLLPQVHGEWASPAWRLLSDNIEILLWLQNEFGTLTVWQKPI